MQSHGTLSECNKIEGFEYAQNNTKLDRISVGCGCV